MATAEPKGKPTKKAAGASRKNTKTGRAVSKGRVVKDTTVGKVSSQSGKEAKVTNTTVRLSADEVERLDRLAETYSDGDRSATIRHALRFLDEQRERDAARDGYLAAAREIHGDPTDDELAEMRRRYFS